MATLAWPEMQDPSMVKAIEMSDVDIVKYCCKAVNAHWGATSMINH